MRFFRGLLVAVLLGGAAWAGAIGGLVGWWMLART
jgi:hypothetical protein